MSRKDALFKSAKLCAEREGQPFPYNNFGEWKADAPLREQEEEEKRNEMHYWLADYPPSPDELTYKFYDPASDRLYCISLYCGSIDEFWCVGMSYSLKKSEFYGPTDDDVWVKSPLPVMLGCYRYDDLPFLKMDLIQYLRERFPAVIGWNDDFNYREDVPMHIPYGLPLYPQELLCCLNKNTANMEAPKELYALGNLHLLRRFHFSKQRVAIIGSRKADEKGLDMAYRLGQYHSSEIVVSGLALGIDTAAHKGCLDAGGKTIAVVGSGLDIVHPKGNDGLQKRILDSEGLIISEQPEKTKANPRTLIARTRIQMALADKVVVVECERESGTMHAVNFARQFHKPIFAWDSDWSGNRYLIDNKIAKPFGL